MTEQEFRELLALGIESRRVEFKGSVSWADPVARGKIAKSIMGMSSIRDGGVLVIGMNRQPDDSYVPTGVTPDHLATYVADEVARFVQNYADPGAQFSMQRFNVNGQNFVVFVVKEFEEIPIVCRWDGEGLSRGVVYTRTEVPETVPVPGEAEMRELLEMAVDKGMRKLIKRLSDVGLIRTTLVPEQLADAEMFSAEARDLEQ